ncbi:DUF885 domain-containing protein [Sphingomonas sanxanigenens]|nr:DUF885 domain-containing protein [Sphingomonas sanxanigenens]
MFRMPAAAPLFLALATCLAATGAHGPAAVAAVRPDPGAELSALFDRSDADYLRRNPIAALYRGVSRRADRLGDSTSDAYFAGEAAAVRHDLTALATIDRGALSPADRIAYDSFKWQAETTLRGYAPALLRLQALRPIDHFTGIQTWYPDIASGASPAPFETMADYRDNLARNRDFGRQIDRTIRRLREGMAAGIVQPRLIVDKVLGQLDTQLAQPVEQSPFYAPAVRLPAAFKPADALLVRRQLAASIRNDVYPAYRRLAAFLRTTYRPAARTQVGLLAMPDGAQLYSWLIEANTTLPMTADEIHTLGLTEVARIRRQMDAIRRQVKFKGDLAAFFDHLRTSPRFQPRSADWIRTRYEEIGRKVDAKVREQFSTIPRTRLTIQPVPAYREQSDAGGSYAQGSIDGSRPGTFYYNAYDLPSRFTWGMETLYLHEAIPGHHFQISIAQENPRLPNFQRFGGNTAYVEGWALYAETLWPELGMETDPYQRFGGLNDEMLRAMRLVVDTGIHAKGWTRDQAITYMLANSGMGRTDATIEVDRYIAIPGQALAYKIGQMTILRLKAKAKAALGARFDVRAFHAQILGSGALPMQVLERKIDDWIATERGGAPASR